MAEPFNTGQEHERDTNRRLRAIDWRFLTADPWRLSQTDPATAPPSREDASRSRSPEPQRPHAASGDSGEPETARLRRTRYWAWPSPRRGRAHFWIPLDSPSAIDWFLSSRASAGNHRDAVRGLRQLAWRAARRLRLLPGRSIATAGPQGRWLDRFVGDLLPANRCPDAWILLTGGHRSISKVIALGLRDDRTEPLVVVKLARTPAGEAGLRNEIRVLSDLERAAARPRGIPRVVGATGAGTPPAVALEFVAGSPLIAAEVTMADHLAVTDWLIHIAELTAHSGTTGHAEAVDRFSERFHPVVSREDTDALHAALRRLDGVPCVLEHRDVSPWNVHRGASGQLTILDWESAEPRGLPVLDLTYYLAWSALVDPRAAGTAPEVTYARLRDVRTAEGRRVADCEHRYREGLHLDGLDLRPLRLLTWAVHSASEYERLVADTGTRPSRRALHDALCVKLWNAELRWADRAP